MCVSPRWLRPRVPRVAAWPVRLALTFASFLLVGLTGSCASARRLVSPAPAMPEDVIASMTAWTQTTDSLNDLKFTPDAVVSTPWGDVSGELAVEALANGTLEEAGYTNVALSVKRVYVCSDRVVVAQGDFNALAADSGETHRVTGPFVVRTVVDAQGVPRANLVRLNPAQEVRVGTLARSCNAPSAYRFAGRRRGITVFGYGLPLTTALGDAGAALDRAGWSCPASTSCSRNPESASAGIFAEAYDRLRPGIGVQLIGGRLWNVGRSGYENGGSMATRGFLTLHNTIDALGATVYLERWYFRVAAGPALLRSSWFFDANIPQADSLGFNKRTSGLKPALLGSASFLLPVSSRIDVELTAVGDITGAATPPSVLEFQPQAINSNALLFAIGLGIRP